MAGRLPAHPVTRTDQADPAVPVTPAGLAARAGPPDGTGIPTAATSTAPLGRLRRAPWGPGEPPPPARHGQVPPPGGRWTGGPINYWGYQETPMRNPGFNQWGFSFFGVWIPP